MSFAASVFPALLMILSSSLFSHLRLRLQLSLRPTLFGAAAAVPLLALSISLARAEDSFPPDQLEFFEKSVRPVLAENCYQCHGPTKQKSGLRLDSRDSILQGNADGEVVRPGQPSASKLIQAIKHAKDVQAMPKDKPALAAAQIAALEKWVQLGLPWPKESGIVVAKDAWKQHWAFQPVQKPHLPAASAESTPVDALVGAKLKTAGLDFAAPAEPATLCRRLYLDLWGLPPTYEQTQAFLKASAKDRTRATTALIDELLASPRYGERWGRYWLDIARYADTEGYTAGGKDNRFPYAYTYRDWVIGALNSDLPYDKFVTQQLAADRLTPEGKADPSLAALGFLTVNDSFLGDRSLQTDDRIDVVGRGLLGLTVGCARCHDHKYDPIKAKDYYAFYSIFNSCREPEEMPIIGQPTDKTAVADYQKKVDEVEDHMKAFRDEVLDDLRKADRLRDYLVFANQAQNMDNATFRGAAGKLLLRDRIASRWRDFVKAYALGAKPHPVMLAWKEYSALPADQFAQRAPEVTKHLCDPATGVSPLIRTELTKRPAPQSLSDVAALYADVFLACVQAADSADASQKEVRHMLGEGRSPMDITRDTVDKYFTRKDTEHMTKLRNEITKLELSESGAPLRAMIMEDKPKPEDVHVFVRGNPARQGEPAPRAYLSMLGGQKFTSGSGRLELAQRIASRDNPLTARVLVNRVWMQHFGKPLVSQPSDFGVQTPKPEQLELLDYLAATFMDEGWSIKKLQRHILNSRTYQQSSKVTPAKEAKDTENNLLSHFNRQRLDYEAMRDSVLAVAADLNVANAGGHSTPLSSPEVDTRRSVYLFVDRYEQATVPAMFDFANPDAHSPQRFITTVPQQALFLMNSPFMHEQADHLASKLPVEGSAIDAQTIDALYHRILQRPAKPGEVALAERFVNDAAGLQQDPLCVWHYGAAQVKKDPATGKVTVTDFTEFTHFKEMNKTTFQWSPGPVVPDPKWGFVSWGNTFGHPGEHATAATAQWTAPFNGAIRIEGSLHRAAAAGDGVHAWIISSRTGGVVDVHVAPEAHTPVGVKSLEVKKGDVLTFAVTCEENSNSDSFAWAPSILRIQPDGRLDAVSNAKEDFCGTNHWPLNRTAPQTPLSQLVQVLLMSNEFQFVD